MSYDPWRLEPGYNLESPDDDTHPVRSFLRAPGKVSLTGLIPGGRPAAPEAPLQRKARAEDSASASETRGWFDVAVMPDISPLPAPVQARMESAFNADFSDINVHPDSPRADAVGALAYTQGRDIHFAPGQYDPESSSGQELIGHELAHVVQQRQGRVHATSQAREAEGVALNDDPGLEAEADRAGARAARGEPAGLSAGRTHSATGPGPVQRRKNKSERAYADYDLSGTGVTENHLFKGEVKDGEPKGLHAYEDGAVGVTVLATVGNTNKVHTMIWTKGAAKTNKKAKWSSMFPRPMPRGTVCFYIQETKRMGAPATVPGAPRQDADGNQLPGTGWSDITVGKAGDTMYPLGGAPWQQACQYDARSDSWYIEFEGERYTIANA